MLELSPGITCSAAVLSGGRNSRMGGRNKAFLRIGGRTILDRLIETLEGLFDEILLVTRQPERYAGLPVTVVQDIYDKRSSLTGIHAGLKHAASDYLLIVPCDAPFIRPEVIRILAAEIEPGVDVIVPVADDHYEPLCAIYSKRCIRTIEARLERDDFRIIDFFDSINLKTVPIEKLRRADNDLLSFFNVNTPEAYRKATDRMERR